MSNILGTPGKISGMTGIRAGISKINLYDDVGAVRDTVTISTPLTDFAIDANGTISNTVAIEFIIGSEDIVKTGDLIQITDSVGSGILLTIDLDAQVALVNEGKAIFKIGDLTARL